MDFDEITENARDKIDELVHEKPHIFIAIVLIIVLFFIGLVVLAIQTSPKKAKVKHVAEFTADAPVVIPDAPNVEKDYYQFRTTPDKWSSSDVDKWIPNSVEVQLLDDSADKWKNDAPHLKGAGLYGHVGPKVAGTTRPAGEWNRMTVRAQGKRVQVINNGVLTVDADLSVWTSAKTNPDGSAIPPWLSRPWAELPTRGRIGFQGMHGQAKPYFRNIRIRTLGK